MAVRTIVVSVVLAAALAPLAAQDDDPFAWLRLDAHGFASFGHLRSWGNDWLDDTTAGSGDLWEAALAVVARPADRLRIGAQIYARDLGRYDNGRVQLDWAYADWRMADAFGVQAGRIRIPFGLYNEVLDVDAARAQIFLPPSIYALRARDLYVSTDGAKVYGLVPAGSGSFEYQVYAGSKRLDDRMGFATYFGEVGYGEGADASIDLLVGGILQWNTPVEGFALRASLSDAHGFQVDGTPGGMPLVGTVDDYIEAAISAEWELPSWTLASEAAFFHGDGELVAGDPGVVVGGIEDRTRAAYAAATWHATPWLDAYGAIEREWAAAASRTTVVGALCLRPRDNLSLKAEVRLNHGLAGLTATDLGMDPDDRWQVLALKATVDF